MENEKNGQREKLGGKLEKELREIGLIGSVANDYKILKHETLVSRFVEYVKGYVSRMFGGY